MKFLRHLLARIAGIVPAERLTVAAIGKRLRDNRHRGDALSRIKADSRFASMFS